MAQANLVRWQIGAKCFSRKSPESRSVIQDPAQHTVTCLLRELIAATMFSLFHVEFMRHELALAQEAKSLV